MAPDKIRRMASIITRRRIVFNHPEQHTKSRFAANRKQNQLPIIKRICLDDFFASMETAVRDNQLMGAYMDLKFFIKIIYLYIKRSEVFKNDIPGQILSEVRGKNEKSPTMTVTVLDSDDGKTNAEVFEQGKEAVIARFKNQPDAWHRFVEWYKHIQ